MNPRWVRRMNPNGIWGKCGVLPDKVPAAERAGSYGSSGFEDEYQQTGGDKEGRRYGDRYAGQIFLDNAGPTEGFAHAAAEDARNAALA